MDKETSNIESWGNTTTNQTRDVLSRETLEANERNRLWWETLPMTYEDWDASSRDPESAEDFDRLDRHYFGTNPYLKDGVPWQALAGKKVLEIGCGAGSAACRFAASGAEVTAVDITAKAVALTQRHAVVSNVSGVVARQQDAEDLSGIPNGNFDYLYSWGVMHHSARPERCFAEACTKLKPGAQGLIMVYHRHSFRFWGKGLAWLFLKGKVLSGDTMETVQRHYTDGYYHRHYTRESLRLAMEEAGFRVEGIDVTHMSSRMIPFLPEALRQSLKRRMGWLIVARVRKP